MANMLEQLSFAFNSETDPPKHMYRLLIVSFIRFRIVSIRKVRMETIQTYTLVQILRNLICLSSA